MNTLKGNNPLLDFSGLPRFAEFKPDYVTPAIDQLLADCRAAVARAEAADTPAEWDAFVAPLDDANEKLGRVWGQVSHLHSVMDSPELREVYNANLPKITVYYAELGQNEALFAKFKALKASPGYAALSAPRKKIVDNELRDFRLGGAELPADKKARFMQVQEELAQLSAKFEENLLDATNDFALYVDDAKRLAGIPDDVLAMMKAAAEADGKAGWKLTLHMPSYLPVMQYADDRALREQIYRAYVTRASEFPPATASGDKGEAKRPQGAGRGCKDAEASTTALWDNTPLIASILKLRREAAELLGFRSYAEVSLAAKMADTPTDVLKFLDELAARARPYAEKDYDELKTFARDTLGMADLQAWDNTYVSEKLSVARYSFSDQEVKQYFPEPRVLAGLFKLVETLYGLHIREDSAPVWHPDVKFYTLTDHAGQRVGQFYLDLYARASKRGGAWMDDVITRRKTADGIQTPVAYLNCNFSGPVGDKPALFTHDEVITLFHETGHGLHHLLTQIEELGVSGINGVEWDAVELPSQFMENFCWEWDVLKHMTAHVDTGEPLPRALFDKMLAAKNFQSGLQTLRQIEFASFDMHLHDDFDPNGNRTAQDLIDDIRRKVAVIVPPAYNRFPNNFSHIFAGGYAAGYYSYKWAEVLSADAYALFEDEAEGYGGVLNPEVGHRFWSEILAQGGARPALESFKAFRGREPTIDALLRHNGMA
ncbi:M3 family metallopeptidase [Thiobacillus sp.]|uniref:M3 family metallopeptidase n=1 Tax=Thiobacillus sp. TaxID=924 RepID=UPI00183A654E|nr:M3 family metallopeptidase [Thiobacillus sp.]MBC2730336.1 M3 family metallopeptidase [Thiobacillus sp.]MBC2739074.1 M3 family metallopeptidase [Thiobacillus sp.]MBC2760640.1 M3 family metallopeptidase [Thiobacillus sp.]